MTNTAAPVMCFTCGWDVRSHPSGQGHEPVPECPAPERCLRGPDDHAWSTDCEMDEGWADL